MPIRLRLSLVVTFVACVLVLVGGTAFELILTSGMHATLEDFLHRSADRLERDLGDGRILLAGPHRRLHAVDDQSILQVLGRTGRVEYTTTRAGIAALATAAVRREARRGPIFVQRSRVGWHDPRLVLVEAIPGRRGLDLAVGASLDELANARSRLFQALFVGGPLIVALVGIGSWLLAGVALRPVERLRAEAMTISTIDPDRRLAVPSPRDEIARLARTLNDLLDLLQGAIARQREFVAVASHELRTPLAVLRAEVELARRPGCTEEEMRRSLDVLGPRIAQLIRLSDDLLLLASGDEGELRLFATLQDLEPLVASSLQSLSATAEARGVSLALDAAPGVAATVDAIRFHQIVDNLVANALDHGVTTPLVEVNVSQTTGGPVVEVQDRGPGFPDDLLPTVFDRFTRGTSGFSPSAGAGRSHPARGGVGLGLAVVRMLVQAHGGTVEATNRDGGGARVVVRLPRVTDEPQPRDARSRPARSPVPQGCRRAAPSTTGVPPTEVVRAARDVTPVRDDGIAT